MIRRKPPLPDVLQVARSRGRRSKNPQAWSGLIGLWSFAAGGGPTAYDIAGGNDGTLNGQAWAPQGLQFGDTDFIDYGVKDVFAPDVLTLAILCSKDNPSASFEGGVGRGVLFSSPNISYGIDFHAGDARFAVGNTADVAHRVTEPIGDSLPHLWVCTFDGSFVRLYKDGRAVASMAFVGTIDYTKSSNAFVMGGRTNGTLGFNGTMNLVGLWDRSLGPAEVQRLFLDTYGLITPVTRQVIAAPPAAIVNQLQGSNLGADLFNGTLI